MRQAVGMSTPAFRSRRDRSVPAVERVARWCEAQGADVFIPDPPPILHGEHRHDDGDLYVNGRRVEVKHRNGLRFDRRHFPYPTCYICSVRQWEQAQPRPLRFMIVNESMSGMLIFNVATTRRYWTTRAIFNRTEQRDNLLYECPVRLGRYVALL